MFLSDLNWEQHLRSMPDSEVESVTLETVKKSRYNSIQRYLSIVQDEEAELVIIAGDVTGDGSCGHGFHNAFLIFLSMLEELKIPSCFISGNHDDPVYYSQVVSRIERLKYANEISNRVVEINGMKILGVPYETTYSKSKIKNLLELYPDRLDIVVAHSQLKRRIRLFELDTSMIITGHYDRKHFKYQGSTFISLDNDDKEISYATLSSHSGVFSSSICIRNNENVVFRYTEVNEPTEKEDRNTILTINLESEIDLLLMEALADTSLVDESGSSVAYMKYLRGTQYLKLLSRLAEVKSDVTLKPTLSVTSEVINLQITANYRVSESLIIDYLGKRTR